MKNLKFIAIIAFLMSAFFAINSCNVIRCDNAYPNFTLRYNGQYTGIDTLINVDGYFTIPGSDYVNDKFSFYRDGTLLMKFTSKKILSCYEKVTDRLDKFNKDKFYLPFENDSIVISTWFNPGLYKIQNDTIIAQAVFRESALRTRFFYISFKILSKEKLLVIKYNGIDRFCDYCNKFLNQELQFYPAWRPDSTDNWIRDCLREKKR